jgi:hypothetical protein
MRFNKDNRDVLLLIFEELQDDKESLYSCLLVNRTWCITAVPILWKNPSQYLLSGNSKNILFSVIFSHLSEESRNILKNEVINDPITEIYQSPLFNYINYWKYLDLYFLKNIIPLKNESSNMLVIVDEILNLFINSNTKFVHLSIPQGFDYQLHKIPGAEHCFSELESFCCYVNIDPNILDGLTGICKSIKKLRIENLNTFGNGTNRLFYDNLNTYNTNSYAINYGIIKFIEVQKI